VVNGMSSSCLVEGRPRRPGRTAAAYRSARSPMVRGVAFSVTGPLMCAVAGPQAARTRPGPASKCSGRMPLMSRGQPGRGPHPGKLMIAHAMGSWLVRVSGVGRWFGPMKFPVR
jgi:hypothetical protein